MEKDDKIKGAGNSLDFRARMLDVRAARFLSLDPEKELFPWQSPFAFASNSPITFIDQAGEITKHYAVYYLDNKPVIKYIGQEKVIFVFFKCLKLGCMRYLYMVISIRIFG